MNSSRYIAGVASTLLFMVGLSSCASIERDEVAAPMEGGTVVVRAGNPLVVSLPPDPGAAAGWVLQSNNSNLALIGGPDYTPEPRPAGLVGVANTTAYRFRAIEPGDATLEFVWVAPPGQPAAPARTIRYDVKIVPPLPSSYRDFLAPAGKDGKDTLTYWFS
jgi:inhibitor of cysteine peptidase